MKILVNGAWREIQAASLSGALAELGYGQAVVATAINGEFIPVTERERSPVQDGDRIEVLAPMQGG